MVTEIIGDGIDNLLYYINYMEVILSNLNRASTAGSRLKGKTKMYNYKCSVRWFFLILPLFFGLLFGPAVFADTNNSSKIALDSNQVKRFGTVIGHIKRYYVKSAKDEALFAGAIRGMLNSLDPHSAYLDVDTLKNITARTEGNFAGIGIEVIQEKGIVKVISPIDGTPAQKAGIKAGDYILAIDNKPLIDIPLNQAIKKMRGKKGTKLTLTVINKQDAKPRVVQITRDIIKVKSIKSKMLEKGFGYIRLSHFQDQTDEDLVKAVKKLQKQAGGPLNGLILDLRNNPGGLLDSSVEVADAFLDSQKIGHDKHITYTKGRAQITHNRMLATSGDILYGAPLVVLVNRGSASASEIVAGALQDHKRAIVMGERSFGKGSVQTVLPIDNETAVKLTTALYYTPKGKSIQAEGIKPDIIVHKLKFQDPKDEEALIFLKIRELDLRRHLKNGENKSEKVISENEMNKLATSDYQLYEALTLLKSLHILHGDKKGVVKKAKN
jgi:carboxyl-terminal processing protease